VEISTVFLTFKAIKMTLSLLKPIITITILTILSIAHKPPLILLAFLSIKRKNKNYV